MLDKYIYMGFAFYQRKTIAPSEKKEKKEGSPDKLSHADKRANVNEINDLQNSIDNSESSQTIAQFQDKVDNKTGQGRVKPTTQMEGEVNVNDDAGLEKEADVMGAKALSYPEKSFQLKSMNSTTENVHQLKENNTGLPDGLKSGMEKLSGYSLDDVKVHYNSAKPAQLQAHAYAQGTDIHLAPGQEKHLPHEAWHVVQQKQGIVKPTTEMEGKDAADKKKK